MATGCPHRDVRFCPLYVAAHTDSPASCDDGRMGEGSCAIARGRSYARSIARLDQELVAPCEWHEAEAERTARRERNFRAAGLH